MNVKKPSPPETLFWGHVNKESGHCWEGTQCWEWTASCSQYGYGQFTTGTRRSGYRTVATHRYAYKLLVGPIPAGLDLDHKCRNRRCCNPAHLEPVTRLVNLLRGETFIARNAAVTHCPQGHPYDEANTYTNPNSGNRKCRACNRERARQCRLKKNPPLHPFSPL